MMNAKSRMRVFYAEGIIEMNTTFAKMMQNPLSDEYALLQKTRLENPTFTVRRRQIKKNPNKDTYKGLTYSYMENYIRTHEEGENVQKVLDQFEELKLISQCHGKRYRYSTIKKWFLAKYPDVAKFGLEPLFEDELADDAENAATQEPIPFAPSSAAPAVAEMKGPA